jgi:hypothetical protein
VFVEQLPHGLPQLGAQILLRQIPKQNFFLLAVMRTVRIGADEIDGHVDFHRVDFVFRFGPVHMAQNGLQHFFNQTVFPHQRSDGFHE